MKALVLGATGHIGQGVVRDLLAHCYAVTAVTRHTTTPHLRDLDVDVLVGDIDRPGQIAEWAAGHDLVVDAAAPKPLGYFPPTRGGPDPIGTARNRALAHIEAVRRTGVRLAYISSFSTLPRPEGAERDPGQRWRHGYNAYFRAKDELDRILLEAGQDGLPIAILNPSAVFGPWETCPRDESLVARVLDGKVPWVMKHVVSVIDVRDLASGIRIAAESEHFGRQTAISGHDISLDDLARRIAALGRAPPPLPIHAGFAVGAGLWIEWVWALWGRHAPTAVCAAPVIADAWPMGTTEDLRALGVEPRPLEETLVDAVRWRAQRL